MNDESALVLRQPSGIEKAAPGTNHILSGMVCDTLALAATRARAGWTAIGRCPQCGGVVFEDDEQYFCEGRHNTAQPCRIRMSKVKLGQTIVRGQMEKLLSAGRTDLLTEFLSKRKIRFAAYLVFDQEEKIICFEFPEN